MFKEHEKFWAFAMLGLGVMLLAVLAYFYPPTDGSGAQRIIDAAMGGLLLALGSAANALFRIGGTAERQEIGEAAAHAIHKQGPMPVEVVNPVSEPIPVDQK